MLGFVSYLFYLKIYRRCCIYNNGVASRVVNMFPYIMHHTIPCMIIISIYIPLILTVETASAVQSVTVSMVSSSGRSGIVLA